MPSDWPGRVDVPLEAGEAHPRRQVAREPHAPDLCDGLHVRRIVRAGVRVEEGGGPGDSRRPRPFRRLARLHVNGDVAPGQGAAHHHLAGAPHQIPVNRPCRPARGPGPPQPDAREGVPLRAVPGVADLRGPDVGLPEVRRRGDLVRRPRLAPDVVVGRLPRGEVRDDGADPEAYPGADPADRGREARDRVLPLPARGHGDLCGPVPVGVPRPLHLAPLDVLVGDLPLPHQRGLRLLHHQIGRRRPKLAGNEVHDVAPQAPPGGVRGPHPGEPGLLREAAQGGRPAQLNALMHDVCKGPVAGHLEQPAVRQAHGVPGEHRALHVAGVRTEAPSPAPARAE